MISRTLIPMTGRPLARRRSQQQIPLMAQTEGTAEMGDVQQSVIRPVAGAVPMYRVR
jgi:hypothetical protein